MAPVDNVDSNLLEEESEELVQMEVCFSGISVKEALESEDKQQWLEAMEMEKLKLEAYKSWRILTPAEADALINGGSKPLPLVIILTRKRCGKFKARGVMLGNMWHPSGEFATYSPTVSYEAARFAWIFGASEGYFEEAFDIENAFLQADLPEDHGHVVVRLPDGWSSPGMSKYGKLLKAVYGLPTAPRAWYQTYDKSLRELGWVSCPGVHGLYKKASKIDNSPMILTVYVDDNVIFCRHQHELEEELRKILEKHPGSRVKKQKVESGYTRDLLGADHFYDRNSRELRITMTAYIEKIQKKFHMVGCKKRYSPGFDESALLNDKSENVAFPIREVVGALQWVSVICRPDITQPTNSLARFVGTGKVRQSYVAAAKQILAYLVTTKDAGVCWSPEIWRDFAKTYNELGSDATNFSTFSDASFASRAIEFRSISGSVVYFRGAPIAWKSQKQTMRAMSTSESEYIACSDSLAVYEQLGFSDFLFPSEDSPVFVDNQSAIAVAKGVDNKKKSRHFMLRFHRVKDNARRLFFCPDALQKADMLTKNEIEFDKRMRLFHTSNCCFWDDEDSDVED